MISLKDILGLKKHDSVSKYVNCLRKWELREEEITFLLELNALCKDYDIQLSGSKNGIRLSRYDKKGEPIGSRISGFIFKQSLDSKQMNIVPELSE